MEQNSQKPNFAKGIYLTKKQGKKGEYLELAFKEGESYKKYVCFPSSKKDNNIYFPAWAENLKDNKSNETKYNQDNSFKIVFTGNVGEAQNFDQVIKAAVLARHPSISMPFELLPAWSQTPGFAPPR